MITPSFLTAHEIYRQLTTGPGAASLFDAVTAGDLIRENQLDRAKRIMALAQRVAAGWQGEASERAQGAVVPLAQQAINSADQLRMAQRILDSQASSFRYASTEVRPVAEQPPEGNFWNDLLPWETDLDAQIRQHQADAQHNIQVFARYDDESLAHETAMPLDYGEIADPGGEITVIPPDSGISEPHRRTDGESGTLPDRQDLTTDSGADGTERQGRDSGGQPPGADSRRSPSDDVRNPPGGQPLPGDRSDTGQHVPPPGMTAPGGWRGPDGPQPVGGGQRPGVPPGFDSGTQGGPGTGAGFVNTGYGGSGYSGGTGSGRGHGSRGGGSEQPGGRGGSGTGARPGDEPGAGGRPADGATARPGVRGGPAAAGTGMVPLAPGQARNEDDYEHETPSYLENPDPDATFGLDRTTTPPVIGE